MDQLAKSFSFPYVVKFLTALFLASFVTVSCAQPPKSTAANAEKPNIVFILTDDQGMGDVGVYGNPIVQTPNIDQLHSESVRLNDFHVDPTCSPTRAALMTGKHSLRAGVWHTVMARHMLAPEHHTLPEVLKDNGYVTAQFGKWHLGDNYPYRPQDQGFDVSVMHGGGGVGQTPDYWGNSQFGDTYFVNGKPKPFAGFSTQVWFEQARQFIQERAMAQKNGKDTRPFFSYISLNAPHSPWRAPAEDLEPYLDIGLSSKVSRFYGMISNLDREVGALRTYLDKLGIAKNTVFIFMTDNGTAMFERGVTNGIPPKNFDEFTETHPRFKNWTYNAGMRGFKTHVYDGGHRVPFFIHWPKGAVSGGRDVDGLSAHFDILPTLVDLLDLQDRAADERDGISLAEALRGKKALPERTLVVTNQRVDQPVITRPAAVLSSTWRYLPNTNELFNLANDPAQEENVVDRYPAKAKALDRAYKAWWADVSKVTPKRPRPILGTDAEPVTRLTSHDFIHGLDTGDVAWFPGFGSESYGTPPYQFFGKEAEFQALPYELRVSSGGKYRIQLYYHDKPAAKVIPAKAAMLEVNGKQYHTTLSPAATRAQFDVQLDKGELTLTGWFGDNTDTPKSKGLAAFFAYIEKI